MGLLELAENRYYVSILFYFPPGATSLKTQNTENIEIYYAIEPTLRRVVPSGITFQNIDQRYPLDIYARLQQQPTATGRV